MSKKKIYFPILLGLLMLCSFVLAACGTSSFTITFMSGSAVHDKRTVTSGTLIDIAEITPSKEGYEFAGWYFDDETFADRLDPETDKVNGDVLLYAKFITDEEYNKNGYNVTFVTNGGSEIPAQKYVKIKMQPISKKNGSMLVSWHKDSSLSAESVISYPMTLTSDITLYAKWEDYEGVLYVLQGNKNNYTAAAYSGNETEIVILREKDGKPVTKIADNAFEGLDFIESITIPDTVTSIGAKAFYGCNALSKVNSTTDNTVVLSSKLNSIGEAAFGGCNLITDITVPFVGETMDANASYNAVFGFIFGYTVTDNMEAINGATYQYHDAVANKFYHYNISSSIQNVTVLSGELVPWSAFYGCKNIKSIDIKGGVVSIMGKAFYGCSSLTSLTLAALVPPVLKSNVFTGVNPALQITVPSGVEAAYRAVEGYKDYII